MEPVSLSLTLTPQGHLVLARDPEGAPLQGGLAERLLASFERGSGHGLLALGAEETATALPPILSYWREFGARYVTALCTQQEGDVPPPPED